MTDKERWDASVNRMRAHLRSLKAEADHYHKMAEGLERTPPQMRVDNEAQAVVLHKALKAYSLFVTGQDEPRLSCLIVSAADLVSDFEDRRDP